MPVTKPAVHRSLAASDALLLTVVLTSHLKTADNGHSSLHTSHLFCLSLKLCFNILVAKALCCLENSVGTREERAAGQCNGSYPVHLSVCHLEPVGNVAASLCNSRLIQGSTSTLSHLKSQVELSPELSHLSQSSVPQPWSFLLSFICTPHQEIL